MIESTMSMDDRRSEFEARLAALKHKMERGLIDRARLLRDMASRLERGDEAARREIKTESHKLRGVAGSYGHHDLTELAAKLEERASVSPPASVSTMARELADMAERKGADSKPPPPDTAAAPAAAPQAPRASERPRAPSVRPTTGAPLRVLATDDDLVTQRLLTLTLKQVGGFDATVVGSAAAALALLKEQQFDIVISDAMMPDMNGREFRRAARAAGATVPIVILSAAGPDELGWPDDGEGPGGWLRKPFKPSELVRDLAKIAAAHGKR